MARKEINIGIEGNDGTGDSIRDSFGKVNDNFSEIYAVLGIQGNLSFIGLADTPDRPNGYLQADENAILVVDAQNEKIVFKELIGDDTIIVNKNDPGVIKLSSLASALINDGQPTLANDLNANFKRLTNVAEGQLDTDAATKGYVDGKISLAGVDALDENGSITPDWGTMTGPLILSRNPIESDDVNYNGLIAATKAYVDSKTFLSAFNLYVGTNGQDERTDIPANQIGRAPSTAFRTIAKAAEVAEELVNAAPVELGPYQKTLTYNSGTQECTLKVLEESPLSGVGATGVVEMQLDETQTIEIVNGGTDYEIGDEFALSGGTATTAATVRVIAKNFAGSITQLAIVNPGIYSVLPPDITEVPLVGGASGSGTATVSVVFSVNRVLVTNSGSGYGTASVIFNGGGGSGAEATVTEIAGEIKEISIVRRGAGYTTIPTASIFLPRMLLETEGQGTDFLDDLREGQLLRGKTTDAIARIISHSGEVDASGYEIFEVQLLQGTFQIGEVIEYGDPAQNIQITIQVETGIYYEQLPIRLAPNVSLRGDEFRRCIIRPEKGVSTSKWSRVFFRRDKVIDGLKVTPYEFGYHYLTDPLDFSSRPKNNDEMDVFLCGDATLVRNFSVQGHGGFMMVLDPESQINSKSPYCQTGSSFAKSINAKAFHGGQFVDGFVGNLDGILLRRQLEDVTDPSSDEDPNKVVIGGLQREPELPTSFNIGEDIYRITLVNKLETEFFDVKVLLEANRQFIQDETVSYILATFPTLVFDQDKCSRDVGLIVDAVIEDTLYGGYQNSTQAGRLYFSNGATVVGGQVSETAAGVAIAKAVALAVIEQSDYPRLSTTTQTKISSINLQNPLLAQAQQTLTTAFDLIRDIILYGEKIYAAKALIQANKEFIQAETLKYVNINFPALVGNYNTELCYRDTGLIIDALSIDIFGDYNNSLRAGYSYYRAGKKLIPQDQVQAEVQSVEFIKLTLLEILQGQTPSANNTEHVFNPSITVDPTNNSFNIPNHGYTSGSRIQYNNGGGTSIGIVGGTGRLTNNGVYYVLPLDSDNFRIYETLELVTATERTGGGGFSNAVDITDPVDFAGTTHSFKYHIQTDQTLTVNDIQIADIDDRLTTATGYIKSLIAGDEAGTGVFASIDDSTQVPEIYPQYECVLDNPYTKMVGGKITLATPGNKSMLGNDFTQVNDMGYGIFAMNNGLIESVSIFTYYCYNAFYALNGAQIRSLNGSSAHGVYGLRAEGADPNEVPDTVTLKFPVIQRAQAYFNSGESRENNKDTTKIFVYNYSYTPRSGMFIDVDHSNDPQPTQGGTNTKIGFRSYKIATVTIFDDGVAECTVEDLTGNGLKADIPHNKWLSLRLNDEIVLGDKVQVVSTRPSTALVFDENRGNENSVIRVLSFAQFTGQDAIPQDVVISTKDGFPYIDLSIKETDTSFTQPVDTAKIADDALAVQSIDPAQKRRLTFQIEGQAIYDGSTLTTGGMIFQYQQDLYEITGVERVIQGFSTFDKVIFTNLTDPLTTQKTITISAATKTNPVVLTTSGDHGIRNGRQIRIGVDNPVGGMTELNNNFFYAKVTDTDEIELYTDADLTTAVDGTSYGTFTSGTDAIELFGGLSASPLDSLENISLKAGIRAGATGDITVNISTMRATGHDFLDIGTGSYADTNYPSNIFGPPNNVPTDTQEAVEVTTGRVFWVSSDQSGTFRVGEFFAVDQGTGKVTLDAKIDLQGITSLRLGAGESVGEFSADIDMGGDGEADGNAVPTEAAIRTYIDRRLGLTHEGGKLTNTRGPGFLPLDGSRVMEGDIEIYNHRIRFMLDPDIGADGEQDAVPKSYMKMGNLQDAPEGWLFNSSPVAAIRTPVYDYIEDGDILAFTGNGSEFTNVTVDGAFTFSRVDPVANGSLIDDDAVPGKTDYSATIQNDTDPKLIATMNDNVLVNSYINYNAGIEQHKLDLNLARAIEFNGVDVASFLWTGESSPGAGDGYTTVTTTQEHLIPEGDAIIISGDTGVTALNGSWKATNVTQYTFDIPADTSAGGTTANAKVRHGGILNGANNLIFTLNNGFLDLKDSTDDTRSGAYYDGIPFSKLQHLDNLSYDVSDNDNYDGIPATRVLGRRKTVFNALTAQIPGPPVPIAAETIIEDGDGLSRAEVPSVGVVHRTATGTGPGKFATITKTSAATANTLVERDVNGGASFTGTLNAETLNITNTGSPDFDGGTITVAVDGHAETSENTKKGLKFTVGTSTATVVNRLREGSSGNIYFSTFRNGGGFVAIKALYNADAQTGSYTDYNAPVHNFNGLNGVVGGTINVGSTGKLTAGGEGNTATIEGQWSLQGTSRMQATWADLAEYYSSDKEYEPGTVVMFGGDAEVTKSNKKGTTKVAGVVTTNPAFIMNKDMEGTRACVALQGRVPCKVIGKISKGDLMVASEVGGVACSVGENARPGTIIGKALEDYDSERIGTIEVAVGRL